VGFMGMCTLFHQLSDCCFTSIVRRPRPVSGGCGIAVPSCSNYAPAFRRDLKLLSQERLVSAHLVLELADLPDNGFPGLSLMFCDGPGEFVRLGRRFLSRVVEVVDDCGKDRGPSSEGQVEVMEC